MHKSDRFQYLLNHGYKRMLCILFIIISLTCSCEASEDNYLEFVKREFCSEDDKIIQDAQKTFIVICQNKDLAQKILERECSLYKKFHQTFKSLMFWDNPTIVKIFPDRTSYINKFKSYSSLAFMAKFRQNSMTHRLISSWEQENLIENLIPHETAHIFVADLARIDEINSSEGKRVLPRWIDEGIAQYFETNAELLDYKIYMMHIASKEGGLIPFDDFFSYTDYPPNTYYFYIQSEVFTHFLFSRPNGYNKLRNYLTIFRSKIKDGKKAFALSFPEYSQYHALKSDFLLWTKKRLKNYSPDIKALNKKIASNFKIKHFNERLYKEIALGNVAYQLLVNKNYKRSVQIASSAIKNKNGFSMGHEAQIASLYELNQKKSADHALEIYTGIDEKNGYRFTAELKHKEKKYSEEIKWLKKWLAIDKDKGFCICMRIAYVYNQFLGDLNMARDFASKAQNYLQNLDEFY